MTSDLCSLVQLLSAANVDHVCSAESASCLQDFSVGPSETEVSSRHTSEGDSPETGQ